MSVADAVARVAELTLLAQRAVAPASPAPSAPPPAAGAAPASFEAALAAAGTTRTLSSTPPPVGGGAAGERMLAVARGEVGQAEVPPGSNDGPRIADYRASTAGAVAGAPWCAYFVSWAAAAAGAPLGDGGSGLGSVDGIASWAARTGRLLPAWAQPAPGDLVLFGSRHVGIVEAVNPDGSLTTVEGNSSNAVSRVVRPRAEATGYVRLRDAT